MMMYQADIAVGRMIAQTVSSIPRVLIQRNVGTMPPSNSMVNRMKNITALRTRTTLSDSGYATSEPSTNNETAPLKT